MEAKRWERLETVYGMLVGGTWIPSFYDAEENRKSVNLTGGFGWGVHVVLLWFYRYCKTLHNITLNSTAR